MLPKAPPHGIHRVTSTSKRGRQMISPGRVQNQLSVPDDIKQWNAAVEACKAMKKAKN